MRMETIFERSHVPRHKLIDSMYLLVTSRKGISSPQLAKEIGTTQKSAWFVLQRLREACGNDMTLPTGVAGKGMRSMHCLEDLPFPTRCKDQSRPLARARHGR